MSLSTLNQDEHQESATDYSDDTMFRGRVRLRQHREGYRFSVDAVLLSSFAANRTPVETLDLGTGCGVVALLLADLWQNQGRQPALTVIERQPSLAALARYNIDTNEREHQIRLIHSDLRLWAPQTSLRWGLVVCNPPYQPPQQGRISPHPERAAARHELYGSLEEIVCAGASVLTAKGSMIFVYPASLFPRLLRACLDCGLQPVRLRWVHPRLHEPAKLVLVEVMSLEKPWIVEHPLILYRGESTRDYTEEAELIFAGQSVSS